MFHYTICSCTIDTHLGVIDTNKIKGFVYESLIYICCLFLDDIARLDTLVTVIDANNFDSYISSIERLSDKYDKSRKENDERNISHLLIDQIEFSNVILINKIDYIDKQFVNNINKCENESKKENEYKKGLIKSDNEKIKIIENLCKKLNPNSIIYHTLYSKIDLSFIINTKLFSFDKAQLNKGWLKELRFDLYIFKSPNLYLISINVIYYFN